MRAIQRLIVRGLNRLCMLVDDVAYRPEVVRLGMRLPRWWNCGLAKWSMRLDERWHVGFWGGEAGPAVPGEPCEACHRRAAIFYVGGYASEDEREADDDFLAHRRVDLCGWCHLPFGYIENERGLQEALRAAAAESIAWRWRWKQR